MSILWTENVSKLDTCGMIEATAQEIEMIDRVNNNRAKEKRTPRREVGDRRGE
jgi:hypothetical protein